MKIKLIVEKTKTGFSAYAEKQNIFSVGGTIQELKYNMLEAVNLFYSEDGKEVGEKDLFLNWIYLNSLISIKCSMQKQFQKELACTKVFLHNIFQVLKNLLRYSYQEFKMALEKLDKNLLMSLF